MEKEPSPNNVEREKKERIKEVTERFFKMARLMAASEGEMFRGRIRKQLGVLGGGDIGVETMYNSPHQGSQMVMALAMSHDPRIEQILHAEVAPVFNVRGPIKNFLEKWGGVLNGLKIIDLGCGFTPSFARAARELGAEVYTVDVIPADKFDNYHTVNSFSNEPIPKETEKMNVARKFHIQIDLAQPNALEKIIEVTGGDFDLVTEAHLPTGVSHEKEVTGIDGELVFAFSPDEEFYSKLLKQGGIYFSPTSSAGLGVESTAEQFQGYLNIDVKI